MKWERGHRSEHVQDRRGRRGGKAAVIGGGSAVVLVIVALVGQVLGVDVSGLFGGGSSSSSSSSSEPEPGPPANDPDKELVEFVHFTIDDIQAAFDQKMREKGKRYEPADLVLFTEEVDTRCGAAGAAIGPFYCPPDRKAYIDLSFYRVLKERLGAGGDFAEAYVLAHELGHHLQNLMGVDARVQAESRRDKARANALSVLQELQADCFAGVWASTTKSRILEHGDIEESINAAAQIGDDRLQKMSGQKVNPETWTHGSSAQRVRWFKVGFEKGDLDACDTFASAEAP
jgi:predicted metalloprotease